MKPGFTRLLRLRAGQVGRAAPGRTVRWPCRPRPRRPTLKFTAEDRAFLTALLQPLPRKVLRRLRLIVRPDTILRRHRDLMRQRHANAG